MKPAQAVCASEPPTLIRHPPTSSPSAKAFVLLQRQICFPAQTKIAHALNCNSTTRYFGFLHLRLRLPMLRSCFSPPGLKVKELATPHRCAVVGGTVSLPTAT